MRTFSIFIIFLLVFGFGFKYLYEHPNIITNVMGRFCDSWTECDDKGNRIKSNEPASNQPYEVKSQY